MKHAKFSASSMHIWAACPGMPEAVIGLPDTNDAYSSEGSLLHKLTGRCLVEGHHSHRLQSEPGVTAEMLDYVQICVDAVEELRCGCSDPGLIEHKVDLSWLVNGVESYGTCDYALLKGDRLHMIDFKFGEGIFVDAKDNMQLLFYALGMTEKWDFKTIIIEIIQPRFTCDHGVRRSVELSAEELIQWGEDVFIPAVNRSLSSGERIPGPHCKMCRAFKNVCCRAPMANIEEAEHKMREGAERLSDQELSDLLSKLDLLSALKANCLKLAERRLIAGGEIPGYTLGRKRKRRKWQDEKLAENELQKYVEISSFYEKSFASPVKAEKILQRHKIAKPKSIVNELCESNDTDELCLKEVSQRALDHVDISSADALAIYDDF